MIDNKFTPKETHGLKSETRDDGILLCSQGMLEPSAVPQL